MLADLSSKIAQSVKSLASSTSPTTDGQSLSPEDAACVEEWGVTLAEEATLLQQLRDELVLEVELSPDWDDATLCRYLRARKHDIPRAKAMVLETIKWRAEVGADGILDGFDFPEREVFHQHYPEGFYCTDRSGRPVYVQRPGSIDCDELWKFTTLDRSITYHIKQQEKYVRRVAPAASVAAGQPMQQSVVLIDMQGVGVSTLTGEVRSIMAKIMQIDQDYYPELMHKALIINAPTTFRVIWAMIKYLIDSRTQAKITVLPVDHAPELLKHIAPENLMQCYGGTNVTPLIDEPGPWQDPVIAAEVLHREEARRTGQALGAVEAA